jgi:hypothetical protein
MNIVHLVSPVYNSGFPNYNYAGENGVNVFWSPSSEICLDYINVTLYYIVGKFLFYAVLYSFFLASPTVLTLYPDSGPTTGGTVVAIWGYDPNSGSGYVPTLNYCCLFGLDSPSCVTATYVDSSHITCVAPPTREGTFEVYIKVLQNGYAVDSGLTFRYYRK